MLHKPPDYERERWYETGFTPKNENENDENENENGRFHHFQKTDIETVPVSNYTEIEIVNPKAKDRPQMADSLAAWLVNNSHLVAKNSDAKLAVQFLIDNPVWDKCTGQYVGLIRRSLVKAGKLK